MDDDAKELISELPLIGSGYAAMDTVAAAPLNAKVFWNPVTGYVEVFLEDGGWLGIQKRDVEGDIAPWAD